MSNGLNFFILFSYDVKTLFVAKQKNSFFTKAKAAVFSINYYFHSVQTWWHKKSPCQGDFRWWEQIDLNYRRLEPGHLQCPAIDRYAILPKIVIEFIVHLDKISVIFNMNYDIINSLAAKGLSTRKISTELNTSQSNVRYWLKKFNIKITSWLKT